MSAPEPPVSGLPASWRVQLPIFEGPLDLLLHLVRINRVEITDIPVATICDQFQEYLRLMEELDLDIAAEFVYEAAVLIQIKSRLLLPRPAAAGEPEEDPRRELVERLLEYRRLKEAAQTLAEVDRLRQGVWPRPATAWDRQREEEEDDPDPGLALEEVSLFDLLGALRTVLDRFEREHPEPLLVPPERFTVRDQFEQLLATLEAGRTFDLLGHLRALSCRAEAIAAFLAVLELVRLSLVRLHQAADGGIVLFRTTREARAEDLEGIVG
ncbi:MAG TPA: segregation/condensation protein A [Thermoanaerobaculia bacterium]|jgi:segregation and condensation protein A|nr:segregation/condensation protein A [Thermoanaerobaculia bacterium]MDI9630726.1 segregation/condensation protein A [Acidobacteriota bacterium]OQC40925.1 MAG: Segregation and condensation protein A [Acidobacteria bacterium ADurb.Bin051]MBP7811990.1 segregation/condensation protein A [Thermoanaerobaculia bacterium]MBP8845313.1 segregation/condensation protein A [Thermoanaerobaculia bacterium]